MLHEARRDKWLGATFPWQVIHIPAMTPPGAPLSGSNGKSSRKCKPGKKRRINLRIIAAQKAREREGRERAETERRNCENKAKVERRALRNKDKKSKRRAREKAKKLTASNAAAVGVEDGAGVEQRVEQPKGSEGGQWSKVLLR